MHLTINDRYIHLDEIATAKTVSLDREAGFRKKIEESQRVLLDKIKSGKPIYGVTTGYGESGKNYLDFEEAEKLQQNLYRFHGCGLGELLSIDESRLVVTLRMISLSKGFSGISFELLEAMETLLAKEIYPAIPSQGSVGASGDLTPLSYVAAVLAGEREVIYKNEVRSTVDVFGELGIKSYHFKPKEALAIMNGTTVMSAIALAAFMKFEKTLDSFISFCAGFFEAMLADTTSLMDFVHEVKPHPGQIECAKKLLERIHGSKLTRDAQLRYEEFFDYKHQNIQDRYSVRCIPQVLGPVFENMGISKRWLETEINSASDNPLVCVREDRVYTGCNFYGGYIAHACDTLKICLANTADLLDKQFAALVDEKLNNGLGENLKIGNEPYFHGFKAMQITLSSLSADVLTRMLPGSLFSRSTESLNQDKVSMGTTSAISFRDTLVDFEKMLAVAMLGLAQAFDIRGDENLSPFSKELHANIRSLSEPVTHDRRLDHDILLVLEEMRKGRFA
jgi:histidine ammonia-lyase